jgi:hypothetical protein
MAVPDLPIVGGLGPHSPWGQLLLLPKKTDDLFLVVTVFSLSLASISSISYCLLVEAFLVGVLGPGPHGPPKSGTSFLAKLTRHITPQLTYARYVKSKITRGVI